MNVKEISRYTIHDIAQKAGTSATTVSRVLNNTGYPVSNKLRKRVLEAAQEFNYSPNLLAKSLKRKSSTEIGVIIPTVTNPYYASIIQGVESVIKDRDYSLLPFSTFREGKIEARYLQTLYEKQVRGVILSAMGDSSAMISQFVKKGMHIVLLDQQITDLECGFVYVDCEKGASLGVEHLIENGHRDIAFISTPLTRWTRKSMLSGYKHTLASHGVPFDQKNVIIIEGIAEKDVEYEGYEFQCGREAALHFNRLGLKATAVLAVNDMMAFGFMQQISALGYRIPQDVSIVGFDDILFSSMVTPPLTTIRCASYEVGKLSANLLFERMNSEMFNKQVLEVPLSLVQRNSVARKQ